MIRVAAVGDVHLAPDVAGRLRPAVQRVGAHADVLLLAGDLTRHGTTEEAEVVADEFADLPVPVVAVLGNHDYQCDDEQAVTALLESRGIQVLEGASTLVEVGGAHLGIAGVKGFGGGFVGRCASAFGEPEMKAFVNHTEEAAAALADALKEVGDADAVVALTHYAPVPETLSGEPPEIFPFLGCYQLGEAIDNAARVDLAVHGHAHAGSERASTPAGVPVRNVAQPVIRTAYAVYELHA